jgi:hypothetical protein
MVRYPQLFRRLIAQKLGAPQLSCQRALKRLWGSFEGRLGRRIPLETAPIRISVIARGGLVVNDFCGWFVMKKGRGQIAAVSEKPTWQADAKLQPRPSV